MIRFYIAFINIIIALIMGIFLDKFFNYFIIDEYNTIRFIMQISCIIIIVILVNNLYMRLFKIRMTEISIFFISVFLGVQQSLWKEIYNYLIVV